MRTKNDCGEPARRLSPYAGRFAPSPTGPLHFGSLIAAMGSFLDAKASRGKWMLRIEDIDEPRTVAGAADAILSTLETLGFEWDGEVIFQSRRKELYRDALDQLKETGMAYPCSCSRKDLESGVYSGKCRTGAQGGARSVRVKVDNESIFFNDAIQGKYGQNLEKEVGDFVVLRADGFFAYQLAVVVDDHEQGITHVVRGADLLDSTPRQMHLQRLLGYNAVLYSHLPVAVNENNEKLSKQTLAPEIRTKDPAGILSRALSLLGQEIPEEVRDIPSFWASAIKNWNPEKIPKTLYAHSNH